MPAAESVFAAAFVFAGVANAAAVMFTGGDPSLPGICVMLGFGCWVPAAMLLSENTAEAVRDNLPLIDELDAERYHHPASLDEETMIIAQALPNVS